MCQLFPVLNTRLIERAAIAVENMKFHSLHFVRVIHTVKRQKFVAA